MKINIESSNLPEEKEIELECWVWQVVTLAKIVYLRNPPEYMHDHRDVTDVEITPSDNTESLSIGSCISAFLGTEGIEVWTKAFSYAVACVHARPTLEQRLGWNTLYSIGEERPHQEYADAVSALVHKNMFSERGFASPYLDNEGAGDPDDTDDLTDGPMLDFLQGLE